MVIWNQCSQHVECDFTCCLGYKVPTYWFCYGYWPTKTFCNYLADQKDEDCVVIYSRAKPGLRKELATETKPKFSRLNHYLNTDIGVSGDKRSCVSMVIYGGMGECAHTVNGEGTSICVLEPCLPRAWVFSTSLQFGAYSAGRICNQISIGKRRP